MLEDFNQDTAARYPQKDGSYSESEEFKSQLNPDLSHDDQLKAAHESGQNENSNSLDVLDAQHELNLTEENLVKLRKILYENVSACRVSYPRRTCL